MFGTCATLDAINIERVYFKNTAGFQIIYMLYHQELYNQQYSNETQYFRL